MRNNRAGSPHGAFGAADILALLGNEAVDPDHVTVMGLALDKATLRLENGNIDLIRDILASKIISIARTGERDPDRLCDDALIGLGVLE